MSPVPHEVAIAGVFFPPLLLAAAIGAAAAWLTAILLNVTRLSRFFYCPPVILLALSVLYTGIIGTILIPV